MHVEKNYNINSKKCYSFPQLFQRITCVCAGLSAVSVYKRYYESFAL